MRTTFDLLCDGIQIPSFITVNLQSREDTTHKHRIGETSTLKTEFLILLEEVISEFLDIIKENWKELKHLTANIEIRLIK